MKFVLFYYWKNSGTESYWLALDNADNDSAFSSEVGGSSYNVFLEEWFEMFTAFYFREGNTNH